MNKDVIQIHFNLKDDIIPILDFDTYENTYNSLQRLIDENGNIIIPNTVEEPDVTVVIGGEEFETSSN